jgi:hypothetical protein
VGAARNSVKVSTFTDNGAFWHQLINSFDLSWFLEYKWRPLPLDQVIAIRCIIAVLITVVGSKIEELDMWNHHYLNKLQGIVNTGIDLIVFMLTRFWNIRVTNFQSFKSSSSSPNLQLSGVLNPSWSSRTLS